MGFKNEIKARVMVKATEVMGLVRDETTREWVPTKFKGLINTDTWIFTPDASCIYKECIPFMREANFKKAENNAKKNQI
jgi:hypothetical protein